MKYWLDIWRFARRDDWSMAGFVFGEMWRWADMNAMYSHDERPWSSMAYSQMLSKLYPDQIPFYMRKTFRDRLWKMWRWPVRNALLSHYERPWKPQIKYDEIPF